MRINTDIRQCLIYDSPDKSARLIGVEYMITPRLYETLESEERKLWHSHVYEVKSGMLVMPPASRATPSAVWDKEENAEMEQIIPLYGKTYHMWQVDRGDKLPLGAPELMVSFTSDRNVERAEPKGLDGLAERTKERFGVDMKGRAEIRRELCPDFKKHPGKSLSLSLSPPLCANPPALRFRSFCFWFGSWHFGERWLIEQQMRIQC